MQHLPLAASRRHGEWISCSLLLNFDEVIESKIRQSGSVIRLCGTD